MTEKVKTEKKRSDPDRASRVVKSDKVTTPLTHRADRVLLSKSFLPKLQIDVDRFIKVLSTYSEEHQDEVISSIIEISRKLSYDFPDSAGENIKQNRPTETFDRPLISDEEPRLSIPVDRKAKLYPGKRVAGDVREFLSLHYAFSEDGEPLTLAWLEANDPKAHRALYTQSTAETGPPSKFLSDQRAQSDRLLRYHNIDLHTAEGLAEAHRLYGLLHGRLFPKRKRDATSSSV